MAFFIYAQLDRLLEWIQEQTHCVRQLLQELGTSPLLGFPEVPRIALPVMTGKTKIAGIKIHHTRMMRLLEVLLHDAVEQAMSLHFAKVVAELGERAGGKG